MFTHPASVAMDAVGLEVLEQDLAGDRTVLADAAGRAADRINDPHPGHLQACAYELARFYNVLERMLQNICGAFENHFEHTQEAHEKLITRLARALPGPRPALLPEPALADIRELKRFRLSVWHARDLTLRAERLRELVTIVGKIDAAVDEWCASFLGAVRREQTLQVSAPDAEAGRHRPACQALDGRPIGRAGADDGETGLHCRGASSPWPEVHR